MEAASKEGKQEESPDTSTDQEMVPLSEAGVISEVTVDSIISYIKEATKLFRIAPYIIVSSYFREWQEYFILYAWWMNSNYMYLKIENWCRIFFSLLMYFFDIFKAQYSRSLPGKAMYSKKPPAIDPYPGLYHTVKSWSVSKGLLSRKENE